MDWKSWKYKNLTVFVLMFLLAFFLGSFPPFKELMFFLGYSAAFLAGVIFISTFTAPIAAAALLVLAQNYPLPLLWFYASAGAIVSDFFFFKVVKDGLGKEIEPLYEELTDNNKFRRVLRTKNFRWMFPVIGALIILSPFPKQPGIEMLGMHKLSGQQYIFLSTGVNIIGIAFILLLSFFIKP